jgi:hypothetical protein
VPHDAFVSPNIVSARCRIIVDGSDDEKGRVTLTAIADRYTGVLAMAIHRGDVGDYTVELNGIDSRGLACNPMLGKVTVVNGNNPPSICGITAPDTLDLPTTDGVIIHLEACVQDASGLKDIKRVIFYSFLPSGQMSLGSPFVMFDDATHGDAAAGDGQYSLDVLLPSTAARGAYRFEFQAYDLGNLSGAMKVHTIVIR